MRNRPWSRLVAVALVSVAGPSLVLAGTPAPIRPEPKYMSNFQPDEGTQPGRVFTSEGWQVRGGKPTQCRWAQLPNGEWTVAMEKAVALQAAVVLTDKAYVVGVSIHGPAAEAVRAPLNVSFADDKTGQTVMSASAANARAHLCRLNQAPNALAMRGEAGPTVDGNPETAWISTWGPPHPKTWVIVDTGRLESVAGLTYTPSRKDPATAVKGYGVYGSKDSYLWALLAEGQLQYKQEAVAPQTVRFPEVAQVKYLKFECRSSVCGARRVGVAELAVVLSEMPDGKPRSPVPESRLYWYLRADDAKRLAEKDLLLRIEATTSTQVGGVRIYTCPCRWGKRGKNTPKSIDAGFLGLVAQTWADEAILPVLEVREGSPAKAGGLLPGDVIVAVGGVALEAAETDATVNWLLRGHEPALGRAVIEKLRGAPAEPAASRLELTVLRAGRTHDLQLPLHRAPRFTETFPYDCPLVASMRQDMASYSAKYLTKGPMALGKTIIPKSMAALTLLGSHDSSHGELLKKCVDEFLANSPNGVGGRPWTVGHAGMMLSEYYLATGDERVLPWLKETLAWAPQGTHISKFEVPVFGHGIAGIPYGQKSLVAPNIPMLAFDGLAARRCGVKGDLWRLLLPYMTMSWYDPAEGGHGGVGYGAGTRTWRRQGWHRTGGFALAATLQGAKHIQDGTAQYMSNHHWGMRDTHAYGAPGAVWGLLALSAADPEGFQHVMRQWAWQFVLAWEPGYGLRYSTYHMGCPYLPPETILTCGYGAVFSAENKGLHITGGQARNWLDVSGLPRAPRPVVVRRGQDGTVQIRCTVPGPEIRYTLHGGEPTQDSTLYEEPFELPLGGVVTACSFGTDGTAGPIAKQTFGTAKTAWKVIGRGNPTNRHAFDGNPDTYWRTIRGSYATLPPYEFTVDLGKQQPLAGITVAHRTDHMGGPQIKDYTVHVSADGKQWGKPVSEGELADRTSVVRFPSLVHARYLRLSALNTRGNWAWCSFAEFDVIGPLPELAWDKESNTVVLTCPEGLSIRYSLDGTVPTGESPIFGKTPYRPKPGDRVYARCANDEGWLGRPVVFDVRKLMVAMYTRKAFKGKWRTPPDFSKLTPASEQRVDSVNREGLERLRVGALVFTSSMTALARGDVKLWVTAHNGAKVYIDERLVLDCPPQNRRGNRDAPPLRKEASVPLEKGVHALRIECVRGLGDACLGFGVDCK